MDDLISRAAAKAEIRNKFKSIAERCEINEVLNSVSAVDAVPITRCKDCKLCKTEYRDHFGMCMCDGEFRDANDYCSWAEWRDSE